MESSAPAASTSSQPAAPHRLVKHRKCDDWGRGLLLWEREGKRSYQFEDGQVRVFKEGFFHLLESIDHTDRALGEALAGLAKQSATTESRAAQARASFSFGDQLAHFLVLYRDGFDGEAWQTRHRGKGERRHLKRHRNPVLDAARDRWTPEVLRDAVDNGRNGAVMDAVLEVLGKGDLVPKAKLDELAKIGPDGRVASAIVGAIEGEECSSIAFDELRGALGSRGFKDPGWALLTSIPALAHPNRDTVVKPSVHTVQAAVLGLHLTSASKPTAGAYLRYREVALSVHERLESGEQHPADLLDVFDFVWATLRPSERGKVEAAASKV